MHRDIMCMHVCGWASTLCFWRHCLFLWLMVSDVIFECKSVRVCFINTVKIKVRLHNKTCLFMSLSVIEIQGAREDVLLSIKVCCQGNRFHIRFIPHFGVGHIKFCPEEHRVSRPASLPSTYCKVLLNYFYFGKCDFELKELVLMANVSKAWFENIIKVYFQWFFQPKRYFQIPTCDTSILHS